MKTLSLNGSPLSLTNDGKLQIVFIGVGSAFASTLYQTNFIIIKGDQHIFVDFGMTGQTALEKMTGLKTTDIEYLLPTHSHADHIGGFEGIALQNRYVGIPFFKKNKVKVIITQEYQRILWDRSIQAGLSFNEEEVTNKRNLSFGDYFNVIRPRWKQNEPREIHEIDLGGIHIELFRTKHIPDNADNWEESFVSYGMFIDDHVFISGDTRFDLDLINLYADKSSVMFHDAQFFNGGVHASLDELKTLPKEIKNKMYLIHYPDNWQQQNIEDFAGWTQQGLIYMPKK